MAYVTASRKEKFVASNFRADVYVSRTHENGRRLGTAWPESAWLVRTGLFTDNRAILFNLDLRSDQVALIEDLRAGGDLVFKLDFHCDVDNGTDPSAGATEVLFHVNRSTWITCMSQFGLDRIVLLEVEIPTGKGELETAAELLARARQELNAGNYDGVVHKCRLAIESVHKALKLDNKIQAAVAEFAGGGTRRAMTKRSRGLLLSEAARHYSHPALHVDDDGGTFDYGRRDAAFMLSLASAVVANASSL